MDLVGMEGFDKQKRVGDRLGKPENAPRRKRRFSARGYAVPTGVAVTKAQLALMKAAHAAAGRTKPKEYGKFMDEMVPTIATGYEIYVGSGEFERRRKAGMSATERKIARMEAEIVA